MQMLIEYIIEKMELDKEIVSQHTTDWNELQDAIIRLKRSKIDEAKCYEPSDDELAEYVAHKPKLEIIVK